MTPKKEDAMAKKTVSKKKAKEQDFMKEYNSIQGQAIPEKLTREFVNSLDIKGMTEQEATNLISYAAMQVIKGKHEELFKHAVEMGFKNKHLGVGAFIVEMALSE